MNIPKRILSKLRGSLPYLLSLGVIAIFVRYLVQNSERYQELLNLSAIVVLGMLGLVILTLLGNGLTNYFLYRLVQVVLGLLEAAALGAVNTLANQLPFAGGIVVKGAYLKQRHSLSYSGFLGATMASFVLYIASSGLLGAATLFFLSLSGRSVPLVLWVGYGGMMGALLLLWLPRLFRIMPLGKRVLQRLEQIVQGWYLLRTQRKVLISLVIVQIGMMLVFAGRLWLAFHTLSQEVTVAQCLLFSSATTLTQLVSITPGSLGVREGIVAAVASLLGFDPGVSIVAVSLDRLVATSVVIATGSLSTYYLSRKAVLPPSMETGKQQA